jgi:hypothetical protein
MIPPIRSSRACRLARSKPRNPVAIRATPRSNATTLASPRAQKLPWELRYPSLAVRSLLRESGTTLGAKGSVIDVKLEKLDRPGPRTTIRRDDILTFYIQTHLQSYFTIYNSRYITCRELFRIFNCLLSSNCMDPTMFNIPLEQGRTDTTLPFLSAGLSEVHPLRPLA